MVNVDFPEHLCFGRKIVLVNRTKREILAIVSEERNEVTAGLTKGAPKKELEVALAKCNTKHTRCGSREEEEIAGKILLWGGVGVWRT